MPTAHVLVSSFHPQQNHPEVLMTSLDADTLLQRLAALFPSCIVAVPALDAEHPAHHSVDFARLSQLIATMQLSSNDTAQVANKRDIYAENKFVVSRGGGVYD